MKAAVVGETALEIRDVPMPKPKPNEVLVKVRAVGLNRAELPGAYGSGHTRVTGTIPGIECSGEVAEIGAEVAGRQSRRPRDVQHPAAPMPNTPSPIGAASRSFRATI